MLSVRLTDGVVSLLDEAASCSGISEKVKADAERLRGAGSIPWEDLKCIASELRANPEKPIYLHQLCSHKDVEYPAPPPKEKSPELQARLARLQAELDNKRYSDMVADITESERKAEEMRNSILPTSRLQLSFGAHVLVTMFTFWAVAYYGSKFYLSYDELWAGLAGALGLTVGLLLETLLLIIRSNRLVPLEERMPELFDTAKVKEAYELVRQMKQAEAQKGKGKAKQGAKAAKLPQAKAVEEQPPASDTESKKVR
ncbi:hypothetical protein PLESTB_001527500 [Pleodorina starrii]|uniref:Endoplasmic reticulum-based factor for assembly of V-ATPase n=1 Tax=Pleodorina starrii TaxID=330485 RepID=A0A9W6F8M5_9CHLO|nr:hypothetical protein PLESTB_001527500 [Pleodorina starrii]